jgi:poly(A) polymerase
VTREPHESRKAAPATVRIDAPWLKSAPLAKVFAAFAAEGVEVRAVGGAVRNALLGCASADVDLATPALPANVTRIADAAGLSVYPTGIDHGTVTVVADGVPFEVTTLRRDVETDGRRAVVAFTRDWDEDAARRDFTINALYCDATGTVCDQVGGLADLNARRVRFIGDASMRIREDYLRILRFFRFTAAYAEGAPDAAGLSACIALKDGIAKLAGERVGAEMLKLLAAPRAGDVVKVMQAVSILSAVLGNRCDAENLERLQAIEAALELTPDALTRLAALAIDRPEDVAPIADRLRLSKAETDALNHAASVNVARDSEPFDNASRSVIYRVGSEAYKRAYLIAWARSQALATDPAKTQNFASAVKWRAPTMPFKGSDVLALGVAPGPRVGVILKAFEAWWIGEDFPADGTGLSNKLNALARDG